MDLSEAESLWPKVIAKIREINGPLASMLKNSRPHSVEGGKIILSVKFAFDKQSLENTRNTSLIVSVVEELSGKRVGINARVAKEIKTDDIGAAGVLTEALKVFGGELIE
jgi:hypothetical protein